MRRCQSSSSSRRLGGEFDYENKYNGKTQEITEPKQVPEAVQRSAQALAVKIHRLTACRHMSRTDMIIAENGVIYTLETNTIPGLTEQSLFPKAAVGINMTELVDRLVKLVVE